MKLLKTIVPAMLLAAALGLSALLVLAQPNQSAAKDQVTIKVTAHMSGTKAIPISAPKGSRFTITLPSNRTTGYSWRLANKPNPAILTLGPSEYNAPSGNGLVGQGGAETWTFNAVGAGMQTLTMEYARPWEKNAQPAKTQVFSVTVQ